jgi:hypothetical protein
MHHREFQTHHEDGRFWTTSRHPMKRNYPWKQRRWIHLPYSFVPKLIRDQSPEIQEQTFTGAPLEASPHPTNGTPTMIIPDPDYLGTHLTIIIRVRKTMCPLIWRPRWVTKIRMLKWKLINKCVQHIVQARYFNHEEKNKWNVMKKSVEQMSLTLLLVRFFVLLVCCWVIIRIKLN